MLPQNLYIWNSPVPQLLLFTCQDPLRSLIIAQILPKLNGCGADHVGRIRNVLSKHGDVEYIVHSSETRRKSQHACHWTDALKDLELSQKPWTKLIPQSELLDPSSQ